MPTTLYLQASGHPALKLCDPLVPCVTGYNPALMDWSRPPEFISDELGEDTSLNAAPWLDDAGLYNPVEPPVVQMPPMGGSRRRRRKQIIKEAILAEIEERPAFEFAPMVLLQEEAAYVRKELAIDPPAAWEIAAAVDEIRIEQPAMKAEPVINAAIAAFDMDEDEEEEMIGYLWFSGKLFRVQ